MCLKGKDQIHQVNELNNLFRYDGKNTSSFLFLVASTEHSGPIAPFDSRTRGLGGRIVSDGGPLGDQPRGHRAERSIAMRTEP